MVSITCPWCLRTSYHPKDVEHRYCGACHAFHDDMALEAGGGGMEQLLERLAFLMWLKQECGYRDPRPLPDGRRYAALSPFIYTWAIVTGEFGDRFSVGDRWCYHSYEAAKAALDAWDGTGEPQGWHRHPASGRRRPEGNPAEEYSNP